MVDDDDDVENEEDDVDAEYSTETIGDELVAAWGMREEPAEESEEEEGEDTSERPLIEDDEDDYEEDLGDLGDVVDMSLERIDDFEEEYEDDNLKVEGQVSNRRVDLGDVERVREPWPTKSRQGASRQPPQQVETICYILGNNWSHVVTI